jgi:hypothetical protein
MKEQSKGVSSLLERWGEILVLEQSVGMRNGSLCVLGCYPTIDYRSAF